MILNIESIKRDSRKVYDEMIRMYRYSFAELQIFTHMDTTELCLALLELLRQGLVLQDRDEKGIYYVVAEKPSPLGR